MSFLRVGNIQNVGATKTATSENITDVGNRNDIAYAQINKIAGQTMASGFDTILVDEILNNKNITISSNSIFFALPGVYSINVGFRFGSSGDAWTGVRLFNATTGSVGTSFGTGNVSNDPGPAMFNFFGNIVNTSVGYSLQTYRAGATMGVATPDTSAGRAFVSTIVKVS
jgi:hypothetical protein